MGAIQMKRSLSVVYGIEDRLKNKI